MSIQRYVSDELAHFVGRDLVERMAGEAHREEREEKLYERLINILREGRLMTAASMAAKEAIESREEDGPPVLVPIIRYTESDSLRDMFNPSVVSFCEIPVGDVGIHMSKYGPFGIAFSREFLLNQGANPVLYLAEDAMTDDGKTTNGDLYATEIRQAVKLLSDLMWSKKRKIDVPQSITSQATSTYHFLSIHVFPLIKAFKGDSADEDPENYYMEREWRRYGDLDFSPQDVCRMYLPQRFAKRLRADLPDYYGQVTFSQ